MKEPAYRSPHSLTSGGSDWTWRWRGAVAVHVCTDAEKRSGVRAGIVTTYELRVPPATHHSSVLPVLVDHCEL